MLWSSSKSSSSIIPSSYNKVTNESNFPLEWISLFDLIICYLNPGLLFSIFYTSSWSLISNEGSLQTHLWRIICSKCLEPPLDSFDFVSETIGKWS